jgi:hypothetical protein
VTALVRQPNGRDVHASPPNLHDQIAGGVDDLASPWGRHFLYRRLILPPGAAHTMMSMAVDLVAALVMLLMLADIVRMHYFD